MTTVAPGDPNSQPQPAGAAGQPPPYMVGAPAVMYNPAMNPGMNQPISVVVSYPNALVHAVLVHVELLEGVAFLEVHTSQFSSPFGALVSSSPLASSTQCSGLIQFISAFCTCCV